MILRLLLSPLRMREILLGAQTLVISVDLYSRAASIHLSFVFSMPFSMHSAHLVLGSAVPGNKSTRGINTMRGRDRELN